MAYANAARLHVPGSGWAGSRGGPGQRFQVSWPTAKRWADGHRAQGVAGMSDRSSRPHRCPWATPAAIRRRIVHLRWSSASGRSGSPRSSGVPPPPCATSWSAAGSTGSHMDRATDAPLRTPSSRDLVHADVKKLGNIFDGGVWRYVGRNRNRAATLGRLRRADPPQRRRSQRRFTGSTHHCFSTTTDVIVECSRWSSIRRRPARPASRWAPRHGCGRATRAALRPPETRTG